MFSTAFLDIPPLASAGGTVTLPGSKSISNRVLLLAALSHGTTRVHDLLDSDDTRVMLDALRLLGCGVRQQGSTTEIDGLAGQLAVHQADLFMGNAGTAIRPLTAALAVLGGDFTLHGVPRMHERPIGDLVDALRQIGCHIGYTGQDGYPPLRIGTPQLSLDAPIRVRGDVSSQFLTALLMALPLVSRQDVVIDVVGELISKPYIEITLNLLARFGIHVQRDGWARFTIPAGSRYQSPGDIHVEADASSASYFIALGALAAGATGQNGIKILGVGADSIQGDIRFIDAAQQMGAHISSGPNWLQITRGAWPLKAIDLDCNHIPDAAMTLAVMALYADGHSTLRNIASWRVKETDRIAAMATELRKLGAVHEEHLVDAGGGIRLHGVHSTLAGRPSRGLALLLHGWEGSAESGYMRLTCARLLEKGFDVFRLNFRDHGDTHHLNEDLFHSNRLDEVVHAALDVSRRFAGDVPMRVAGYSLGGNFALRLALAAPAAGIPLVHAAAVCPAIDPSAVMRQLESGPVFYHWYFMKKWRSSLLLKRALFPQHHDFDDAVLAQDMPGLTRWLV